MEKSRRRPGVRKGPGRRDSGRYSQCLCQSLAWPAGTGPALYRCAPDHSGWRITAVISAFVGGNPLIWEPVGLDRS